MNETPAPLPESETPASKRRPLRFRHALIAGALLSVAALFLLRYGPPQWHPWIYRFQAYFLPAARPRPAPNYSGPWTHWHANGQKAWAGRYENGRLHGPCTAWDGQGAVAVSGTYRNGLPWNGSLPLTGADPFEPPAGSVATYREGVNLGERAATERREASNDLRKECRTIMKRLERILRERFRGSVGVEAVTPAEARVLMEEEMDRDTPPEELRAMQDAYIRIGLFPEGFDLRQAFLGLMSQQAQGFYIPRRKCLYLIRGMPLPSVVAAHELTHAMQDQLHDLEALTEARKNDDDAFGALQSVLEGEAVLSMGVYMNRYNDRMEILSGAIQSSLLSGFQAESLRAVPLYMQRRLLFPYVQGRDFVVRAFGRKGWKDIRALYADLPESQEQILHPDKYYGDRDRPTRFAFPGLVEALEPGWEITARDSLGEFGVRLLLQTLSDEAISSILAARGWDGDRLLLMERTQEAPARQGLLFLTTWDSPGHAARFATAYRKALSRRFGREPERPSAGKYCWTAGEGRFILLACWGRETLLLDGFDEDERARLRSHVSELKASGRLFAADHRDDAARP